MARLGKASRTKSRLLKSTFRLTRRKGLPSVTGHRLTDLRSSLQGSAKRRYQKTKRKNLAAQLRHYRSFPNV